jgi:hypothetical protein
LNYSPLVHIYPFLKTIIGLIDFTCERTLTNSIEDETSTSALIVSEKPGVSTIVNICGV